MKPKLKSLKDVVLEYPTILFDTCALAHSLNGSSDIPIGRTTTQRQISISEQTHDSAIFFREFLEAGGSFYITSLVQEEYIPNRFSTYKKKVKRGKCSTGDPLKLNRKRNEESKERNKLIGKLEENRRILQFDEHEQKRYKSLCKKYSEILRRNGLKETNIDFLISGVVVSKTRDPTCLISNNFRILYSWNDILNLEGIDSRQLGFFLRRDFDAL